MGERRRGNRGLGLARSTRALRIRTADRPAETTHIAFAALRPGIGWLRSAGAGSGNVAVVLAVDCHRALGKESTVADI